CHALDARRLHRHGVRLRWRARIVHGRAGHAWNSLCLRLCSAAARRGGNALGPAGADPDCDPSHTQGSDDGGTIMMAALLVGRPARKPRFRLRRLCSEAAALALGGVLLIWSLLPVYNMLLIALDPEGDTEFAGYLWPAEASVESFRVVLTQS